MKFKFYILALLATLLLAGSCVPTRHLAPNERLLYKVKLEGVEQNAPEKITALYQQKPNRKFLGSTPYLSIYYFGKRFYNPQKIEKRMEEKRIRMDKRIASAGDDSSKVARLVRKKERRVARLSRRLKEGNAVMSLGEPPAIYDSVLTNNTVSQIQTYLYSKGFFHGKVAYSTTENNKKLTLTYKVTENKPFTYSQITDSIPDMAVKAIYDSTRSESFIQLNHNYDEQLLVSERNRLDNLLKNLGYFEFRKQYILAEVDTSFEKNQVRLRVIITNDNAGNPHQVFRIKKVNFIADASYQRFGLRRDTIFFNNIHFLAYEHKISPRALDKKIIIRPGQRYSLARTNLNERILTNLDMYRFINISYAPADTSNNNLLTATISASPSKRYQETVEGGITYSAQLPGPFANFRLLARNVFGGAELLEVGLRGGLEGQFSALDDKNPTARLTLEVGGNMAFVFPKFLIPFNTANLFKEYSPRNPRTRLNVGYTHIDRQEFIRTNLETTFDYIWNQSQQHQYVFTPLDISIINSDRKAGFQALLDQLTAQNGGQVTTYEKSFTPSIVSSMNFSSILNTNNYNHTLDAHYFRFFIEQAGLISRSILRLPENVGQLKLYRYGRLIADYRRYNKLSQTSFFVSRLNFGIAKPFGGGEILPYDKYFYAGGGTSVRAFQARRLGPGSFYSSGFLSDPDNPESTRLYNEQQGELLIEGNLEYRFKLYGFINGALFTDVGNIWMISRDPSRQGDQFTFNSFYKEFAVGSGFGLRFDFTFLIARLDIATKVYDPAGAGFVFGNKDATKLLGRERTTFNLGIGYPF